MWPFIPGERFPYSNFHSLNQDWILGIVKDFSDKYNNIQQIIDTGKESLQAETAALQAQLQAWYDVHENDISQDLANAISSINAKLTEAINFFDQHAEDKFDTLIDSLPDNFLDLVTEVNTLESEFTKVSENTYNIWKNPVYNNNGVVVTQNKDGSVHIQGTPTQEALYVEALFDSPLALNAYSLSARRKGSVSGVGRLGVCTRNQTNTNTVIIYLTTNQNYNKLTQATAPYRCQIVLFSDTTYNCDLYVQLELGLTVKSYVPPISAIDYVARANHSDLRTEYLNENILNRFILNYKPALEITEKSKLTQWGLSSGVLEHYNNTVHYSINSAANGGFYTDTFLTSNFVLQDTQLEFNLAITSGSVRVWLWGTDKSGGTYAAVINYPTVGHNVIPLDFAYYDIYTTLDVSKPIQFLITNGGLEIADFTVSNLILKSLISAAGYIPNYSASKLYEALDTIMRAIPDNDVNDTFVTSPNGEKWIITVNNNGQLNTRNVIPMKSAFIGNSLIAGWSTFGMAALDNEHDYYYHVTQRIHELKNDAVYTRLSNGNLEHSTNQQDFETAFNNIKPYLTADLDLICIQLGDNVNTNEKVIQFTKSGGSFDTMVNWIHEHCPNTRLIWIGTWYPSIHDWLITACQENNVEFVDILPYATYDNKAQLGQVVHRTEDRTQTLEGTYSVVGSGLRLNITLYNTSYEVSIPSYTSIQDNGNGTFTMTAPYTVIDSTGVRSHPGDSGMLAIANAIINKIGLN